jgi:periplasmic divalent cation tolerance protein
MPFLIYTTTGSLKEAEKIAKHLVENKLVACVNYFPVKSLYQWKGKTCHEREYILLCKTVESRFNKVKEAIKRLHSYEVPAIFSVKIRECERKYRQWIQDSVK